MNIPEELLTEIINLLKALTELAKSRTELNKGMIARGKYE